MLLLLLACNPDPGEMDETIAYRDNADSGTTSGERGTIRITEVLWSGSVTDEGVYDDTDLFIELRNESARSVNLSGWQIAVDAGVEVTWVLPELPPVPVGAHVFIATKDTGCFPSPDAVMPELALQYGEPFRMVLKDYDERLIEYAGGTDTPPFAGGYDRVRSRSMERVELMFGGSGTEPSSWHFYTPAEVDVPNNDRIAEGCRGHTLASPGRANSPDYSGAYSTGSFE